MSFGIGLGGFAQGRHRALQRGMEQERIGIARGQLEQTKQEFQFRKVQAAIQENQRFINDVISRKNQAIQDVLKAKETVGLSDDEVISKIEDINRRAEGMIQSPMKMMRDFSKLTGQQMPELDISSSFATPDVLASTVLSPEQATQRAQESAAAQASGQRIGSRKEQEDIDIAAQLEFEKTFARKIAELRAAEQAPPEPIDTQKTFENATKVRKEFTALSDDFLTIRDSFRRIGASFEQNDGPGDLALIFNYMKMLDPQSVVRESEFATAESSGPLLEKGVPKFIIRWRDKIINGNRLTPLQRREFFDNAKALFQSQLKGHRDLRSEFESVAVRNKLDPRDSVPDLVGDLAFVDLNEKQIRALPAEDAIKMAGAAIFLTSAQRSVLKERIEE